MTNSITLGNTSNVFFSSDFHYAHRNICRGTSVWNEKEGKNRNFNTVEEMNVAIIKSINSRIKENDTLFHMGDWALGGWENIWHLRKQINCKNIIQINGNHDDHIINDKFFPFLEKQNDVIYEISEKKDFHKWDGIKKDTDVTARDMFTEVHDILYLRINKQLFVLSHEPFEVWRNKSKGSIHVHGHAHYDFDKSDLNQNHKRIDVGWKGQVYSATEIMDKMSDRIAVFHH